jgi:hypothetical protein
MFLFIIKIFLIPTKEIARTTSWEKSFRCIDSKEKMIYQNKKETKIVTINDNIDFHETQKRSCRLNDSLADSALYNQYSDVDIFSKNTHTHRKVPPV